MKASYRKWRQLLNLSHFTTGAGERANPKVEPHRDGEDQWMDEANNHV